MARKDLEYGARVIRRLLKRLDEPENLAHSYAEAVLIQARQNAASKPTPQARMAADNLHVEGSDIVPVAGGAPAEVAIGSEFGSTLYKQFHAGPNPRGYWLWPAGEAQTTLKAGDAALELEIQKAIRDTPV